MDTTAVLVIAILVLVVILAFLYRGRIRFALKALGISAEIEGEGRKPEAGAAMTGDDDPGKSAASAARGTASQSVGGRSIQAGRDGQGTFVTGDGNRIAQVKGDRNRVDQSGRK